jgi:hypothetical protein
MVCYAEPVIVNHGVLFCARRCEPWWAMLRQNLTIMLYYTEPVIVIHGVLSKEVIMIHGVLWWASGCQ